MNEVTRYKTVDGAEFGDAGRARKHEAIWYEVSAIMADWPAEPEGSDFANGHGYYQLTEALVTTTRDALLDVAAREHAGYDLAQEWIARARAEIPRLSGIGRLFDDAGPRPVYGAWIRLMCVDRQWRLWGQPYFAANPDEGRQVELASDQP